MKQDTYDYIIDDGIDTDNRRIYYGVMIHSQEESGDIVCWQSVEKIVRAIKIMEDESTKKPIEIHMSSPGGDASALMRLYDIIQCSPCQFKFYGSGLIASAATWIMAVCDERYLYPNTRVLIHDSPSGGHNYVPNKLTDMYIEVDEIRCIQSSLNKMFADNSRMPLEFWNEMVKRDMWLSSEETIALGLADKIVEPKKRGNLRKMRTALLNQPVDSKMMKKLMNTLKDKAYKDRLEKLDIRAPQETYDESIILDETQ